ncbi:hypothetical protein VitviT2T_004159 [Vitis vinifera]|uniref:Uncharacterized protein n=1 Tax=Vitis vinifera TaxID=29760 RepID=A0ABY9BPF7_VITVI|nr:hypothetical protein VitviT2T_004159 [Vitis vinifera]
MRQRSHFFEWLKAVEKIRTYTTHGMDNQKELLAKSKMTKTIEAIARKVTIESAGLLRKTEMKNDMLQAENYQLKLDMATTESSKAKAKEEGARLKWELEWTVFNFTKEKKKLEAAYQQ